MMRVDIAKSSMTFAMATGVSWHWAHQSAQASRSAVSAAKQRPGGGGVTGGDRHIMGFGPHVSARGVEIGSRELGGESRLRAYQLWLPLSHDDLHYHMGQSQGQWAWERPY